MNLFLSSLLVAILTLTGIPALLFFYTLSVHPLARNGWQTWIWDQALSLAARVSFRALGGLLAGMALILVIGQTHPTLLLPKIPDRWLIVAGATAAGLFGLALLAAIGLVYEAVKKS